MGASCPLGGGDLEAIIHSLLSLPAEEACIPAGPLFPHLNNKSFERLIAKSPGKMLASGLAGSRGHNSILRAPLPSLRLPLAQKVSSYFRMSWQKFQEGFRRLAPSLSCRMNQSQKLEGLGKMSWLAISGAGSRLASHEWPLREKGLFQRQIQGLPWEGKGMEARRVKAIAKNNRSSSNDNAGSHHSFTH